MVCDLYSRTTYWSRIDFCGYPKILSDLILSYCRIFGCVCDSTNLLPDSWTFCFISVERRYLARVWLLRSCVLNTCNCYVLQLFKGCPGCKIVSEIGKMCEINFKKLETKVLINFHFLCNFCLEKMSIFFCFLGLIFLFIQLLPFSAVLGIVLFY